MNIPPSSAVPPAPDPAAPESVPRAEADAPPLREARISPWLERVGATHPGVWMALATAMGVLGSAPVRVAGVVLLVVVLTATLTRPGGHGAGAWGLLLLPAVLMVAVLRGLAPGPPAAPESAAYTDAGPGASRHRPVPPGVAARVLHASTLYDVDVPPELLNREQAEHGLTRWLFDRDVAATRSAWVAVWVKVDGEVDGKWMDTRDPADRPLAAIALPALAKMRFRPLTRDGVPIPAVVWVEVELVR